MEITTSDLPQGPFEGSRCLATVTGAPWRSATVRRVNEDGTFNVKFDDEKQIVLPYWYGVTQEEISFGDAQQWRTVLLRLGQKESGVSRANFHEMLTALGYKASAAESNGLWDQGCEKVLGISKDHTESCTLGESESYRLFVRLGIPAKECIHRLDSDAMPKYYRLYWNHMRMGGRNPAEIGREVTLEDGLLSLGLEDAKPDAAAVECLQRFEQEQGIRLPAAVVTLLSRQGCAQAVIDCHSNNPALVDFKKGEWNLLRGMRAQKMDGDYALEIMISHSRDIKWAFVFDDGEEEARVYMRGSSEEAHWVLVAPSSGIFFWDLTQTGLAWSKTIEADLEARDSLRATTANISHPADSPTSGTVLKPKATTASVSRPAASGNLWGWGLKAWRQFYSFLGRQKL